MDCTAAYLLQNTQDSPADQSIRSWQLVERLDSSYIELKDIAQEISSQMEHVDFDPAELDAINNRLDKLYDLEKKYHVETVEELIAKRDELKIQLGRIENSDEALAELQQKLATQLAQAQKAAEALTKLRTKAAKQIEKEMQGRLMPLGMPNVKFSIEMTQEPLNANGQDKVSCYDKHHLFRYGGEDRFYEPGEEHTVVEYMGFRILLLTCYDLRFPVWSRYADQLQYDAIIVVANWPSVGQAHGWAT